MIDIPDIDKMIKSKRLKNIEKKRLITTEIRHNKQEFFNIAQIINIDPEILTSYQEWYQIDQKLYYFKSYNAFEELFMEQLMKKNNIPTITHKIVRCGNIIGLISQNYRKQGHIYKNYHDIVTHENLTNSIQELSTKMTKQDLQEYKNQIYKLLALDIMFGQGDHYEYNINFEINQNSIKLAPIFDNGEIFNNQTSTYTSFTSCIDNLEFRNEELTPDEYTLTVLEENPGLINELSYSLDYNLEDIFDELEYQHKITILKELRKSITNYYKQNCEVIENTLNLIRWL